MSILQTSVMSINQSKSFYLEHSNRLSTLPMVNAF